MLRTFLLLPLLASASIAVAQSLPAGPLPESQRSAIGYPSVRAALDALHAKPGVTVSVRGGWTVVNDPEANAIWSFTPVDDPAHPAVAKRTVVQKEGSVSLEMNVHCEAGKAECDNFVRQFQDLNEQMRRSMQRGKGG